VIPDSVAFMMKDIMMSGAVGGVPVQGLEAGPVPQRAQAHGLLT
jgi:hypothetical protein